MSIALTRSAADQRGFTLIELAMVLTVVAFLIGGLAMTLSAQLELQRVSETKATLDQARDALIGFAAVNGRLPCPASSTSNGQESFCSSASSCGTVTLSVQLHGRCSNPFDGFLPGFALGVTPTDTQGYVLDGWGNRVRYAVTDYNIVDPNLSTTRLYVLTGSGAAGKGGIRAANMTNVESNAAGTGLLYVCSSSIGVNSSNCGSGGAVTITSRTPALLYSIGRNRSTTGVGSDEQANSNNDRVFVTHEQTAAGAGGEYDDQMIWLSLSVLFNRMITAGLLP